MRIRNMKNVWKKIGAYVLALTLAVQTIGVWPDGGVTEVKAAENQYYGIKVTQQDKEGNTEETDTPGLEIGDELTVEITKKTSVERVKRIVGTLAFYDGDGNSLGDCFDEIRERDYETGLNSNGRNAKVSVASRSRQLTVEFASNATINADEMILRIRLRVKRAVNKELVISFEGPEGKGSSFSLVRRSNNVDSPVSQSPVEKEVENKWYGQRKVSFTIAGNSENQANTLIDVPVKNTKTKKARIAVRVNTDNGTEGNIKNDNLGYSAFTLEYTYNTNYLALAKDSDGKEIPYELSDDVKKYESEKGTMTRSAVYSKNGVKRTVTVSFVSNPKTKLDNGDIGIYGDFLYLSFVPAKEGMDLGLVGDEEAGVTVTLKGGQNYSCTEMKTEVIDSEEYADGSQNVAGGTKKFNINYVKSLIKFGDVNGDTYINLIDVMLVLQDHNGTRSLRDDERERANADDSVDNNGKPTIDLVDASLIMQCVNKQIDEDDLPRVAPIETKK